ncbi:outer membrane lipoprotein chaperone LolA [Thermomonas sp. LB-4]|jgi:outer membrane lipoprotein carrier protein|uniref:outer membrane lipoprotein chaperone LolA n=1 Tax=Thermomonas sp. LB-4 TaxID=3102790 RepID=UPI000868A28C|nr:MAG: outer membrane lipoprotein carrier protein LolA [Xanthomonadaceae bacterium SCN 69-48]
MRIVPAALATALLLASQLAVAGARDDLAAFTKGLKGLDGQFSQQVFDVRGKQKEASSGRVAVSTPRLFRWEYTRPYVQLIVADGKTVWVVDPDLDQATRRPQGPEEANSPLAILLEPARLERDFTVKDGGTRNGVSWLDIAPRSADAGFKTARLGFSAGQLSRLEYVDALGQRTAIAFSGWKRNPSFAAGTFAYVPGKGVDVIGN